MGAGPFESGQARRRSSVLACWLGLALAPSRVGAAPPEGEAAPEAEAPTDAERKQAARAEVQAGSAAFTAGDYQLAIDHYEAAMALLPAPKLHYNIAVCHQRLALEAETPEARTRQRDLAIESYNAYLELNPRAEDRLEIAETIRELGGTPVTMPTLKPLFEGDEGDADAAGDGQVEDPGDQSDPSHTEGDTLEGGEPTSDAGPPVEPKPPPYPRHGRFGLMLLGGFSPTMRAAADVDAPGMIALDLHGGGFIGKRRRFLLAAHTALFSGATLRPDGLSFYGYSLGLLGQQTWVVGREAVQIGFGGLLALTGQGLNKRDDQTTDELPECRLDNRNAQIAARTGGLVAPRFDLGILLGPRRRAMISLLIQPSFAFFGEGAKAEFFGDPPAETCPNGETPWTTVEVRKRWQFQLWAGAGFGFRF